MKLLCALVTHDRLEYTQRTVQSWIDTAGKDDLLIIFDNASERDTRIWLAEEAGLDAEIILWPTNLFPGAATNRAWHHGLKLGEFDLLQRSDNDIEYLPGWRQEVEHAFTNVPELGMFGVLNRHEDYDGNQPVTEDRGVNVHWDQVGGNCVIPRKVWDEGFRWQPGAWQPAYNPVTRSGGVDEDSVAAVEIGKNHLVATAIPTIAKNMSFHRFEDYPDYYRFTAGIRGLVPELSV